jgi:hypothetical protein
MTVTLTKDVRIAGVSHKQGEEIEVSEGLAVLLTDCIGAKPKKKAAKKATSRSDD